MHTFVRLSFEVEIPFAASQMLEIQAEQKQIFAVWSSQKTLLVETPFRLQAEMLKETRFVLVKQEPKIFDCCQRGLLHAFQQADGSFIGVFDEECRRLDFEF